MNIFVYSDESGVFDNVHNDYFVFGGLILLGTDSKNTWTRKFSNAEKTLRKSKGVAKTYELKAARITNAEKSKLFRSLNGCYKFGVVIREKELLERIFLSKKDKQRYLDYAYKIAIKRSFQNLIRRDLLNPGIVERLYFFVDEHTTATNGKYELKESLEQELKNGTYNSNYDVFYPPLFGNMKEIQLEFCNSATKYLIRASDIVANRIYYFATSNQTDKINDLQNIHVIYLP